MAYGNFWELEVLRSINAGESPPGVHPVSPDGSRGWANGSGPVGVRPPSLERIGYRFDLDPLDLVRAT